MISERIYQSNQYETETNSIIVNTICRDGHDVLVLDRSPFFPTGGGQPCDTGSLSSDKGCYEITDVYDDSLESPVYHLTTAPAGTFAPGDKVTVTLDWDRRLSNMQRHTGEHMLSGVLWSMYGGINRGFHMGSDYIAIDIELDGRILSAEEIAAAELRVNELIWEDLPVRTTWFDSYEASLALPVRKQVPHEGRVSVVTIGYENDYRDSIACCGTHVSSTGQVGLIQVFKSEPNKGMTRIFFDCGSNAFKHMKADQRVLYEAAGSFSCGRDDLMKKLAAERDKQDAHKARIAKLSEYVAQAEYEAAAACLEGRVIVRTLDALDVNDSIKLGFRISEQLTDSQLLVIAVPSEATALLFSRGAEIGCGALVKEHACKFGGRGGGRPDNARAVFPAERELNAFVLHLEQNVI